jgi:hypothetical protein
MVGLCDSGEIRRLSSGGIHDYIHGEKGMLLTRTPPRFFQCRHVSKNHVRLAGDSDLPDAALVAVAAAVANAAAAVALMQCFPEKPDLQNPCVLRRSF